jgi:hypothetical protein
LGAAIGLGALFAPEWAARVVRLVADPDPSRPGGYSEFRATYGGLLMLSHMMTLVLVIHTPPVLSVISVLPLATGWLGAGFGRSLSLLLDKAKNRSAGLMPVWILTEIGLGLALLATLLQLHT